MGYVNARRTETELFRLPEWKHSVPQNRLGVENLAKYLSDELSSIIEKR